MLIPRLSFVQRGNLVAPANGLLIYQTDNQPGFYFFNGTVWTKISTGLDVTGTQNYVSKFTGANSLGNSQIFDNGTNVGIGTTTPDYRFTVADTTEGDGENLGASGFFYNGSVADEDMGLVGICDNVAGKGMGVVGIGARYGVVGTSFLEGSGTRIGVFGNFDNFNAERKYAVVGHASGTGINYGIYGIAYGGSENWAGYFAGDTYIQTNLGLGVISPTAQLHTNGTVRFSNYMNGFLYVDNFGNLGVSTASSLFNAGTGLSWSGSTLNSVWTASGNNIYNNNSGNVGIGTSSPSSKLHINAGSARISGSTNTNAETGGMLIYDNSSGLGGGTAKKVERLTTVSNIDSANTVIYTDPYVTLRITGGTQAYISIAPKSGYTGVYSYDDVDEDSGGNHVNASSAETFYNISTDFRRDDEAVTWIVTKSDQNSMPLYKITVFSNNDDVDNTNYAYAIVEAYYP